jgi:rRNA maturation endonuclease Nob1
MKKINPNSITRERQIVLMLAKRMRKAQVEWRKLSQDNILFYEYMSAWREANNSYQIASQMLYNYRGLYPRMEDCEQKSEQKSVLRCQDCGSTNTVWVHNEDYCSDCGSRSVW